MNTTKPLNILGIVGSLRKDSLNRKYLEAAKAALPEGSHLEILSLDDIPFYNGELDGETKPAAVVALQKAIADADGLLIATPEYNYNMPGVLKNAIDWASRPAFNSCLLHKPYGLISASMGPGGGAMAQVNAKHVLGGCLAIDFPYVSVSLGSAHLAFDDSFNASLKLCDETAQQRLETYVAAFVTWLKTQ